MDTRAKSFDPPLGHSAFPVPSRYDPVEWSMQFLVVISCSHSGFALWSPDAALLCLPMLSAVLELSGFSHMFPDAVQD
jgi:hypothetical protein